MSAIVDLNATNRSVNWTSSDASIATVDESGKVIGVAEGSATITVTTNDGGKKATCIVTVTPAAGAIVVEISAMNAAGAETDVLTFRDDGTYTAYGMFLGAVEFTYDSTYEVIDGVLTVPNPGPAVSTSFGEYPTYPTVEVYGDTVRFSVLSDNGSEITLGYYELTAEDAAKLGVTVGDPIEEVAVTGVSLTEESVTITTGSKLDLSSVVVIASEEATNKEYAVIMNGADGILKENNGLIGLTEGITTVTVTTTDGGYTATCTVMVVNPERTVGNSYFSEATALAGVQDLTAFGGSVHEVVYLFNPDGTVEAYQDYILSQRGYYSLNGGAGAYTDVDVQMFFDGASNKVLTYTDGKLTADFGIEGVLPMVLTETEMDTNAHFDADVTFAGTLDLSAYVPDLVQEKAWTCHADGAVTSTTNGEEDGVTNSYYLIRIDGNIVTIVLDMGTDGVFTCPLTETNGAYSFTIASLSLTMTQIA